MKMTFFYLINVYSVWSSDFMIPLEVEIKKKKIEKKIIKLLFNKYDKITSKRQYITSIL